MTSPSAASEPTITKIGRVYSDTTGSKRWVWNVYINQNSQPADGVALKGYAGSLDLAKEKFKASFGALIAAGKVKL